MQDINKSRVER